MQILSHRGYWLTQEEKNSRTAINRSYAEGFGLETDVRDILIGNQIHIAVSHDPFTSNQDILTCRELVNIARRYSVDAVPSPDEWSTLGQSSGLTLGGSSSSNGSIISLPLAINVKSDGLGPLLAQLMCELNLDHTPWFAFDMSGPEMVRYLDIGIPVFTRQSEIESDPILYQQAHGVWVDSFLPMPWYDAAKLQRHLERGKKVCVVSPELHGHPDKIREFVWSMIRSGGLAKADHFMLCTDYPQEARVFFKGGRQ